jgi:hypothetical protein
MPMILPPAIFDVPAIIRVANPLRAAPAGNAKPAATFNSRTHLAAKPNGGGIGGGCDTPNASQDPTCQKK